MHISGKKLVIFDCDGVLVDSEPISISVLVDTIRAVGVEIDLAQAYQLFLGRSLSTIITTLRNDFHLVAGDEFLEDVRQRLYARFKRELEPIKGIADVLNQIDRPFCVASSSQPERIRLSLSLAGIIDHFEPNIFSSTMVKNGKPAPDLFLHAAKNMGYEPDNCVVIEDSPAGILAANTAGMRVFAFTGGSHAKLAGLRQKVELLNPTLVFDDISRLPGLLAAVDG